MAHARIQSPPSLGAPLVSLRSSSLQGVVSWLHSVVRAFASNLEAEKQQWESQAQELRGETRELRRRLESLEASPPAHSDARSATDQSDANLGEQLRALERRVDSWREEQLLRRDTEVQVASIPAPMDTDLESMKQDLRQEFETLVNDKAQSIQLSLQQRVGDSTEELSQLLQVHSSALGDRLRLCEERLTALAFGGFQASDSRPESEAKDERRPASTGSSGASNAGGASLESRVARLERNFKGLAAFASTSDTQRVDDAAMSSKQAQLDVRRCTERIQQLEAHMTNLEQSTSTSNSSPELLQLVKELEQRLNEEIQQLKEQVANPKISSEEKMDQEILEEVHRDLLSPFGGGGRKTGGSFSLDFIGKENEATSRQQAIEVASLETKLAALTRQQDDRALQLQQELKQLQQQLLEAQVAATVPGGGSTAASEAATALAAKLSNHDQELKTLANSVAALQASVGHVQDAVRQVPAALPASLPAVPAVPAIAAAVPMPDLPGRVQASSFDPDVKTVADGANAAQRRADQAHLRVTELQSEVAQLAKTLHQVQQALGLQDQSIAAIAARNEQDREQLYVPDGIHKETLKDVRADLLADISQPRQATSEASEVLPADVTQDDPHASDSVPATNQAETEPKRDAEGVEPEQMLERLKSLENQVSTLSDTQKSFEEKLEKLPSLPSTEDGPAKDTKDGKDSKDEGGSEAEILEKVSRLEKQVEDLADRLAVPTQDQTPPSGETSAPVNEQKTPGVTDEVAPAEELRKLQEEVRELSAAVDALRQAESKEIPSPSTEVAEHGKAQVTQKAEAVASPALDDLKQEVNSLTESLNALKESLIALKESQGDLAEVKSLAEALEKSQASTLADVQALQTLVEEGEPAQKVTNLAEEVEALRRQVTEGEPAQKVEHLDTTVRELQDIHEDLKKKVEKASSGEAEIADLKQQVKGLGETVAKTAETVNRSESQSEVSKLKEAFEAMKRRQEEFNLQTEATQRKQLNTIREDMRAVQASQEASAKRQAQIKEGTQSLEKEQLQLASKLRQLEGGRIKQLGQDMQVVKEAILHVQQELRKEVVIPEHVLKDLDAKNESRLEAVWTELQHHAEAAATRADRLEQSLTQRVVHLEHATTILVKAEEHTRSLEQDMQKQSEWFSWRIAWLEWATTGEKRSFARALLPPPSTPAATCFKQPLTEDSELWAQEKTGRQRLRRAPLNNMPNVGSANERCLAVTSPSLSVSSSAPDLQAVGKGQSATRLPEIR